MFLTAIITQCFSFLVGNPTCRQPYCDFFFIYSSESFEDNDSFIESELEEPNIGKQNKKCRSKSNIKQKTGRKPRWSQVVLHDFTDIIVSSDQYKKKTDMSKCEMSTKCRNLWKNS